MEKQRRDRQGNSRAKKMLRGGRRPVACLAVVAALLGLGATGAGAQVRGTIFGPGESAFPLAVARLSRIVTSTTGTSSPSVRRRSAVTEATHARFSGGATVTPFA